MAYEMGRTLIGYEVQKVLAAVDWFAADGRAVGVIGSARAGWLAYLAAGLDSRIRAVDVGDVFGPRRGCGKSRSNGTCGGCCASSATRSSVRRLASSGIYA